MNFKFTTFMFGMLFCFALFIPIGFWARTKIKPGTEIKYITVKDDAVRKLYEHERRAGIR